MFVWSQLVRLAAVLVLLSAAGDYCVFDVGDPWASMSAPLCSPYSEEMPCFHAKANKRSMQNNDLPDDHCLCCGTMVIQPRPTIAVTLLTMAFYQETAPPLRSAELRLPDRPPRA